MSEERTQTPCLVDNVGQVSCEKCVWLFLTEAEQDQMYIDTGKRPDHTCLKYKKRLVHLDSHPRLNMCTKCATDQHNFSVLQKQVSDLTAEVDWLKVERRLDA